MSFELNMSPSPMTLIDYRYCILPEPNVDIEDVAIDYSSLHGDDSESSWEEWE